jgi:hypothetical protein
MAVPRSRRILRRIGLLTTLPVLTTALWLAAATPTVACSCAMLDTLAEYATPESAIFSGTAGRQDGRGVPVVVDTWFQGNGAAPLVYLAASSFGDGSSCGVSAPPPGTSWIWVTYLSAGGGDPATGLCSPSGQLGTPEGNALLAEATRTFRGTRLAEPTEPPQAVAPPLVPRGSEPVIVVGTIGLGLSILAGAIFLARRRSRPAA